ncbi:F-box protein CPR1-like isoform X2 [Abrus precatorius]|uniref:F-box protein CPR1-like isoform X2 n=1 Tax=Abrus precatorius TaxID=3816 RepID=A0A8B8JGP4_ABRPR|nr:F-box protein CPR1-like isoform X2 [Abrus precatorius]
MMTDLPPEVITDIVARLPVKTLLRLRVTCKWWRSLIDSTHFIFFHICKSIHNNNSNTALILRHHSHLYQVDLHALDQAVELNHPLMCYSGSINVLGSCNGLLCISNIADDFALWNPSLRKHRILPADRLNHAESSLFAARVYGFGYDSFTNDYKVVSISYFVDLHKRTFNSLVQLYSMRSDAWKDLPSMPYALCCARTMGVLVGGALHWVVTRKLEPDQPDLIVAFDLRFEKFREVPLPVSVKGNFEMDVAVLGGCLCMVEDRGRSGFDVWVMRVYGSQESWCKVFTVTESYDKRSIKSLKPLGFSSDGDRVLFEQDRRKLCWYNLKSEDVSYVKISGMPNSIEATVCVGSLVPPTLLNQRDESKCQGLRDQKSRKKRKR